MIKITQGQAHLLLNSPVAQKLFNDDQKQFPLKDALIFADFIEQIRSRQQAYVETMRKIVAKFNGVAHENGSISYESPLDRDRAAKEIAEVNKIEMELAGDALQVGDDWPKLTLAEATLIKPFVKG